MFDGEAGTSEGTKLMLGVDRGEDCGADLADMAALAGAPRASVLTSIPEIEVLLLDWALPVLGVPRDACDSDEVETEGGKYVCCCWID